MKQKNNSDELKVNFVSTRSRVKSYNYSEITDVPEEDIISLIKDIIKECNLIEESSLIKTVSEHLGFGKVGRRIEDGILGCVQKLLDTNIIQKNNENSYFLNN